MMRNNTHDNSEKFPDFPVSGKDAPTACVITIFISLYFIVLVFFVVISSMTVFESEKVKAVTGSIKNTFASAGEISFESRFLKLFHNFADSEVSRVPEHNSDKLYLSFVPGFLITDNNTKISPRYRETLSRLYQFLQSLPAKEKYQTEIVLIYPKAELLSDSIAKVSFLAQEFQKQGLNAITTGVSSGKEYRLFIMLSRESSPEEE